MEQEKKRDKRASNGHELAFIDIATRSARNFKRT